jgi:hypothetical protein
LFGLIEVAGVTTYQDAASTFVEGNNMGTLTRALQTEALNSLASGAAVRLLEEDGTLTARAHFAALLPPEQTNQYKGQVEALMPKVAAILASYDKPTTDPVPGQHWRHIKARDLRASLLILIQRAACGRRRPKPAFYDRSVSEAL